jgi:hypothetical protein
MKSELQQEAPPSKSGRRLSGAELEELARRMVESTDPDEVNRLKKELERGFYGDPEHA